MSKSRNLQITYSGGDTTPIQRTIANTGQSSFGADTTCAAGPSTTTITPALIFDPDTNVRCFYMLASGNCTVQCDLTSGTDTSITLSANVAEIQQETAAGTIALLPSPSGNDTLTLKIHNPNSSTISFSCDFLIE